MPFQERIKPAIGDETCSRLDDAANKEVALSMQMPLFDDQHRRSYYSPRLLLGELLADCELFQRKGLKILPTEIVITLFKCKLLRAVKTDQEYNQRSGGFSISKAGSSRIRWEERADPLDVTVGRHISELEGEIRERTLLATLNSFTSATGIDYVY